MRRQHLPSVKVAVATVAAGVVAAVTGGGVDWAAVIVAVATLVVAYLVPELNPAPSSLRHLGNVE